MEVKCVEHTVPKTTAWGTVEKSLNQHIVYVMNDETKKMTHCGYVGDTAFLPLSGFPQELCEEVTAACAKQLNRQLVSAKAPLSITQIAAVLATQNASTNDDSEDDTDDVG